MGKVRRCDCRCHNAKGTRCRCWCGGMFHGSAGAENRAALVEGLIKMEDQPGYKEGEVAYIEQQKMALEVEDAAVA
jgi:hypothetical protein